MARLTVTGTLINCNVMMEGGPFTVNGTVENAEISAARETSILGSATFEGITKLQFSGDDRLAGVDSIGAGLFHGTMTLGAGIMVEGLLQAEVDSGDTLINQGRIHIDFDQPSGSEYFLSGSYVDLVDSDHSQPLAQFVNSGAVDVGGAAHLIVLTPVADSFFPAAALPMFVNQGALHVAAGGRLVVEGPGAWSSPLTTVDAGGQILIDSPLATAAGGVSVFSGAGQWMAYNGQHFMRFQENDFAYGELRGGTVVLASGAVLFGNPWYTAVTVNGDVEETQDFLLQDDGSIISGVSDSEFARFPYIISDVTGGLTLNGSLTLGSSDGTIGAVLAFKNGPQTLGGNAVIHYGASLDNAIGTQEIVFPASAPVTLSIGAGITMTGPAVYVGSVEDLLFQPFTIGNVIHRDSDTGTIINHGTIIAPYINIDGAFATAETATWTNPDGSIVNPGAAVILDCNYGTADALSVLAYGGSISLQGRIQNTGNNLLLHDNTAYTLRGIVVGGIVATPPGFILPADGAELIGVNLVGDMNVGVPGYRPSSSLGLTVNGELRLGSTGSFAANDSGTPGDPGYSGGYTQTATGTLAVTLGRTTSGLTAGQLNVVSAAALDGTLAVSLAPGYSPQAGDSFKIMTFGSLVGQFAAIDGLKLGHGLFLEVQYDPQDVTLIVTSNATRTVLTDSPVPPEIGQTETLTASVTGLLAGAGTPTGSVIFLDGPGHTIESDQILDEVPLNPDGTASITVPFTPGAHHFLAEYVDPTGDFADSSGALDQGPSAVALTGPTGAIVATQTVSLDRHRSRHVATAYLAGGSAVSRLAAYRPVR